MHNMDLSTVLQQLDELLGKNDYAGAEAHLSLWLQQAQQANDSNGQLVLLNEQMGLYRKLGRETEALAAVKAALEAVRRCDGGMDTVGGATTCINAGTVYKAFGRAAEALPLFRHAMGIYQRDLDPTDQRLGGLYNNMGLVLVDLGRFEQAYDLYNQALQVVQKQPRGALEEAVTYLNVADAKVAQLGPEAADETVQDLLQRAAALLDAHPKRDGYYAFVCDKCAGVFGYYGHFRYEQELRERVRAIYERA